MTEKDLREIIELAEQGRIQFKERAMDKYDNACEMCAFCNSKGGRLIVGVKDKSGELRFPKAIANPTTIRKVLSGSRTALTRGASLTGLNWRK